MNLNDFLNVVRFTITKSHISNCPVSREELHTLIDKIMDGEEVIYYDDSKTEIVEEYLLDKLEEKPKEAAPTKTTIDLFKAFKNRAQ